jgi:hypothetical protein
MARGPRFLLTLLVLAVVFFGGIQWERQDCFFTWPGSRSEVGNTIQCPDPPPSTQPATTTTTAA